MFLILKSTSLEQKGQCSRTHSWPGIRPGLREALFTSTEDCIKPSQLCKIWLITISGTEARLNKNYTQGLAHAMGKYTLLRICLFCLLKQFVTTIGFVWHDQGFKEIDGMASIPKDFYFLVGKVCSHEKV